MTLDEAIKENNTLQLPLKTEQDHRKHLAVRLGIEALKRLHVLRLISTNEANHLLPGETAE